MTHRQVEDIVQELAGFPGMDGCALVEAESGMVWYYAGTFPDIDRIAEASIEFWRVQQRLSANFSSMGPLQSAAYAFSQRIVALFPCGEKPPLVLICIAQKADVSWHEWGVHVVRLKKALRLEQPSTSSMT
ncbi:MAG: hypothetical protein KIS62_06540 [Ramlibacter sp.]|nr:hypothetical protein [Ramlibacter sp.]MBX3657183.1 hypothetical protein [Ramlibacter sp.]MCW5649381.1 hypothetical protein [Ramlibacter sp.]